MILGTPVESCRVSSWSWLEASVSRFPSDISPAVDIPSDHHSQEVVGLSQTRGTAPHNRLATTVNSFWINNGWKGTQYALHLKPMAMDFSLYFMSVGTYAESVHCMLRWRPHTCMSLCLAKKKPSHELVVDEVCCPANSRPSNMPEISSSVSARPLLKREDTVSQPLPQKDAVSGPVYAIRVTGQVTNTNLWQAKLVKSRPYYYMKCSNSRNPQHLWPCTMTTTHLYRASINVCRMSSSSPDDLRLFWMTLWKISFTLMWARSRVLDNGQ